MEIPLEEEPAPRFEVADLPELPEERPLASLPSYMTDQLTVVPSAEWPYFPSPLRTFPERFIVPPTPTDEHFQPSEIPEPTTLILLASGLAAQFLIWGARRR